MAIVDKAFREWIADFKELNPGVAESRAVIDTAQYAFAAGRKAQRESSAPNWQPIETAPKDGTAVLATSAHMTGPNGEPVAWAAAFDQERNRLVATWDCEPLNDATHWQPLPASPEVPDGRG